jgi:hypothetical protein
MRSAGDFAKDRDPHADQSAAEATHEVDEDGEEHQQASGVARRPVPWAALLNDEAAWS